ncbi:xylulokinase [Agarilytica rhodophyticola]|uniref:xylulokinase n=1 Tax=Agarilytica rhodophyticola TaxID=1737490 RepID=UPI000B34A041|nr:xylulokinase [Agarilytica rhodophyticola]
MKTVLGIDLGTQSLKVLFYDISAKSVVAKESAALEVNRREDGSAEQDADWWIQALINALKPISQSIKDSVIALSVSGQQHGFVALDKHDNVIAPVKLWCDTATAAECDDLNNSLGGDTACIEKTGNKILTGYTAPKVLHLKKYYPELYAELDTILLPHDYLNFWLTGEKCMEMGDASGTGFLNIAQRTWSDEMLRAIDPMRDLSKCLPPLRNENVIIGKLHKGAAALTGLPENTPVAIGGGDNMMAAIGTGNLHTGRTTVSLGTSGTVYAYSDKPVIDSSGSISAFCSSTGGWLPLLCTMNCTVTTELFRNLLSVDIADFDATIARVNAGASGLITLPFFNGERSPNLPNGKGCLLGMDSQNMTPAHILRSGVEGATFALRAGIQELSRLGTSTDEIILTGGGSQSPLWRQITADIMNVPVNIMKQDEGAAFGAALQAFSAIEYNGICDADTLSQYIIIDEQYCCEPQQQQVEKYNEVFSRYQDAVMTVSALYR